MAATSWRDKAAVAIDAAIDAGRTAGLSGDDLEAYVRKHGYPFGPREMHPYKIWCSEVRRQLGLKTPNEIKKANAKGMPLFGEDGDG
jgi:hypothetical protein